MKQIYERTADGFLAGLMISLGGAVYLACDSKYIGALLFCMGLFCICIRGYSLYTGKIGYITVKHSKDDISVLLLGLLGNAVATIAFGYLIALALPSVKASAETVVTAKLSLEWYSVLIRAFLCGILVYLAVDIYREHKNVLGIMLCIPAFILSGYEHSIADMFYFAASGVASFKAFLFILIVIAGNSLGSLLIPLIKFKRPQKNDSANVDR